MVVVVVYTPDSTYDEGDTTCGTYSQRLGATYDEGDTTCGTYS